MSSILHYRHHLGNPGSNARQRARPVRCGEAGRAARFAYADDQDSVVRSEADSNQGSFDYRLAGTDL